MSLKSKTSLVLIILVAALCIVAAVFLLPVQHSNFDGIDLSLTATETKTLAPTATPSPTPVPQRPKYIFIVIGDGMGFSHLDIGSAYEKILHEDLDYVPYWDRFEVSKDCVGATESAGGGTMIATGYQGQESKISVDDLGNSLVTILDRAKEYGLSTGIISNSYIYDATPSTFYAHTEDRGNYTEIVSQIASSGVDFFASGGLDYILPESLASEYGENDIRGSQYKYNGEEGLLQNFSESAYSVFLGESASEFFQSSLYGAPVENNLLVLFSAKNMSYFRSKYRGNEKDTYYEPDLDEMTKLGIEVLSEDEDGFVFVIEEALIDKASHNLWMEYTSAEMHVLNKTLGVIFDFYEQHPYETLIILTADHETGDLTRNESFNSTINQLTDIDWKAETESLYNFLTNEWGLDVSYEKLSEKSEIYNFEIWGEDDKDGALLHSYIAAALSRANGIEITSKYHSDQKIPLMAEGLGAERFSVCDNIYEIPITICELMEWEALPEIVR